MFPTVKPAGAEGELRQRLYPFLTSHYSKIYVIDPREFNQEGKPSLDLRELVKEYPVDDLIVINYPFMISNTAYVSWLNRLVGLK